MSTENQATNSESRETSVVDKTNTSTAPSLAQAANSPSPSSFINKREISYPSRVCEIVESTPDLCLSIVDAARSPETHGQLQSFIVYSIRLGPLIVKRRYSEFESLRLCLVKSYPTLIVPPIPEKQSIKSNITQTTSNSLGISHNAVSNSASAVVNRTNGGPSGGSAIGILPGSTTNGGNATLISANSPDSATSRLIEYRKRMLAVFLNRCLANDTFRNCRFFLNFLDPETNFHDFLALNENSILYRTSLYRLSPFEPLANLSNQLYLTLPIPSSADAGQFPELAEEAQFQELLSFETKFRKYEIVLDKISKCNKRLLRHFEEIAPDLTDLGSQYNKLSILQDSTFIEDMGKSHERNLIFLGGLVDSINLRFLDRLIELKHFSRTVKELTGYNRKKVIQCKLVEEQLEITQHKYKACVSQESEIQKIDRRTNATLGKKMDGSCNPMSAPITDAELQTALYAKSKKPFYGRIPGMTKLNSVIQKYTDNNPDQTRRNKVYNLKMRLYQQERQHEILTGEIGKINREVMKQLVEFHEWFKRELCKVVVGYNENLEECLKGGDVIFEELNERDG
ncbi:hypothetical protein FOA43_004705 [Brettanomyces nanus]|uniref:PX domain-containing protein n=1 Tax=Eeniella nana TaxID=13502 RepID=A0A875RYF2_EENNA|nr:uncharacterized protein FOA43_004705 [Brettanomyces nanus]QPG77297.1 hypothetical protein FOA43_004705 [Brettanomyces nanus]